MAPRKNIPVSDTKDKGVLRPSKTGVQKSTKKTATKTNAVRDQTVQEAAVHNTQVRVKRFKNGLVNLTKMPDHLLAKSQQNAIGSPLLRLPAEIRKEIWAYAVQVDRVLVPKRYCWVARQHRFTKGGAVAVEDDGSIVSQHPEFSDLQCCPSRRLAAFHLPEVCRQIYIETALLSYSSNIFLVDSDSLLCKSWASKEILLAQRDAIARVELGPDILRTQLWFDHEPKNSLRQRSFRNLTHVYVSFDTQKSLVRDHTHWMLDHNETDINKLLAWCEAKLKDIEGSDLVVVFGEDETPGADGYATLFDIFCDERDLMGTDSDVTNTDDGTTDTDDTDG